MKKILIVLGFICSMVGTSAHAALIDIQVEGGGIAQVYQLSDGTFLGLMGFDNRSSGASDVTITSFSDLVSGFSSGTVLGFFNGTNPINSGAVEFDELVYGFTVTAGSRLFDSLWVQWSGGDLVYSFGNKTRTMRAAVTRQGDPLASVNEPSAIAIAALGLIGMVLTGRRKRKA